jgi:hypothetical protein
LRLPWRDVGPCAVPGADEIQRGRLTSPHRHFGQVTSRTRHQKAYDRPAQGVLTQKGANSGRARPRAEHLRPKAPSQRRSSSGRRHQRPKAPNTAEFAGPSVPLAASCVRGVCRAQQSVPFGAEGHRTSTDRRPPDCTADAEGCRSDRQNLPGARHTCSPRTREADYRPCSQSRNSRPVIAAVRWGPERVGAIGGSCRRGSAGPRGAGWRTRT